MALDLETLKTDVETYLEQSPLAVFYGLQGFDEHVSLYWDTEREPDFRKFLAAAEKAGVKLVIFDHDRFVQEEIDEAFDTLDECSFSREERRGYETRMRELQKYEGFTCLVDLSFTLDGRLYSYRVQADWYSEWRNVVGELELLTDVGEESEDDDSLPGYFSTN
jgi:hypothetical protein